MVGKVTLHDGVTYATPNTLIEYPSVLMIHSYSLRLIMHGTQEEPHP